MFLLRSSYNTNSDFSKQIIWYNKDIKISGHAIFWKRFFDLGIVRIEDLYDESGKLKPFLLLNQGITLSINYLQWYALASTLEKMKPFKIEKIDEVDSEVRFTYEGAVYNLRDISAKIPYRIIRDELLIQKGFEKPKLWVLFPTLDDQTFKYTYTSASKLFKDTKSQAFQYMFINDCLFNNYWLKKWKLADSDLCYLCEKQPETLNHLYWECQVTQLFLEEVKCWCIDQKILIAIEKQNIFLGNENQSDLINILYLLIKRYIYASKCNADKLHINNFKRYVKSYRYIEFHLAKEKDKISEFYERWGTLT